MKTPIRYVFLLLFIIVFIYFVINIVSRLNELTNDNQSSLTITDQLNQQNIVNFNNEFKQRKKVRLRKFENYIDEDKNLDELDLNNVNRSIWKQVNYKSSFGHQSNNDSIK